MKQHKRRESRETAFSLIFEWGFKEDETMEDILEQAAIGRSIKVDPFAMELASKTIDHIIELNQMVKQYSTKWKLNRIPRVTLAVLRMSFCELTFFADIPVGATINEAVELVKKYATDDDAAYVNGLLGQFERDRNGTAEDGGETGTDEAEVTDTKGAVETEEAELTPAMENAALVEELVKQQAVQAAETVAVELSIQAEEAGE